MQPQNSQVVPSRRWNPRSIAILFFAWAILQVGGLFSPGLLDDVDSIYIQIAREMLQRHDFVTPYINGVRFFDKPPLMYWMAAASMRVFGVHDWAARIPLALAVLALFLSVYALGIRLFANLSPADRPDRAGFYAALALASSIGPYLYTRFYIPDILLALWMTLAVHLFLIALERVNQRVNGRAGIGIAAPHTQPDRHAGNPPSPLLPCVAFAAVLALNVLTKGLIGLVFPIAFVLCYLAITRQLHLLPKLCPLSVTAAFLLIAAPWHILAALRTPAIPLPAGLGLPATGGWAWFYLYNEHIARFLGRRIPHDYGQTPVWLFWLYLVIWIMPWATFLPGSIAAAIRTLRASSVDRLTLRGLLAPKMGIVAETRPPSKPLAVEHEAALTLLLWPLLVLIFFSISNRQEYYSLPAIPALALLAGGLLAAADRKPRPNPSPNASSRSALTWHLYLLLPLATALAILCGAVALTAPTPPPHSDLSSVLAANPDAYNVSLGHLSDLTHAAMGFFRGPLIAVSLSMLVIGLGSYLLRRRGLTYAANLTLAAAMTITLLAAHTGLARFYPILGSKQLALAILETQRAEPATVQPDLILVDGELTTGSALIFYTGQQIHVINGRVNGLWYGSLWPDAPAIFEDEASLRHLWESPRRIFLLTCNPAQRSHDLAPLGHVHVLSSAGGKTILTNH